MIFRGLSNASADKYFGAIQGPLSKWAIEHGLLSGPLTSVSSQSKFMEVASAMRALTIFQERNQRGRNMYSCALSKFSEYLSQGYESNVEADIDSILDDNDLSKTERVNLIKSRIGQGIFRQKVLSYWKACAVTGFKNSSLLVASHIKPWRVSNNSERLDPFNGLLLTPNLDRTFDSGLITFQSNGHIKLSQLLTESEKLGITPNMRISLSPQHEVFMQFHRAIVYRAT